MENEEQQTLIKPAQPIKSVRKVNYTRQRCNAFTILLFILILCLSAIITVDIAGYVELKLYVSKTVQPINNDIIQESHDEIQDDEIQQQSHYSSATFEITDENEQQQDKEQSKQSIVEDDFHIDENAVNEQLDFDIHEDEIEQQRKYAEIEKQAELEEEQQIFLQENTSILQPIIDNSKYQYFELPNNLRVLLIQNSQFQSDEITLNVNQGYYDTKYYIKCDCDITFQEHSTIYQLKSNSKKLNDNISKLSQYFVAEEPKIKQINYTKTKFQLLLEQLSKQESLNKQFQYSSNQMSLVIQTKNNLEQLKDFIIQSDLVLIRNYDLKPNQQSKLELDKVIKWNDDKDTNTVKLIYQLSMDYQSLIFIDYFITNSMKNYVLEQNFGLDLQTQILKDNIYQNCQSNTECIQQSQILYQVTIVLPLDDDFEFDHRELAYRLSKIMTTFISELDNQLDEEYFKEMQKQFNQIKTIQFNYQTNLIDSIQITNNLNQGHIKDVLSYQYQVQLDRKNLKKQMIQIQNPENLLIIVTDQQYKHSSFLQGVKGSSSEDLLFLADDALDINSNGLSYSIRKLSEQTNKFIQQPEKIEFTFPSTNPFIPSNFDLVKQAVVPYNEKIPAIFLGMSFKSYGQDILAQYLYNELQMDDATQAGFRIDVDAKQNLDITIYGWSDTFQKVLSNSIQVLSSTPNKEQLSRIADLLDSMPVHVKFIQKELDEILLNQKLLYHPLDTMEKQVFYYGNINNDLVEKYNNQINKSLQKKKSQDKGFKVFHIQDKELNYHIKTNDKWQVLIQYYQMGKRTQENGYLHDIVYQHIEKEIKSLSEEHLLVQSKSVRCVDGFVLIKQSFKDLLQEADHTKDVVSQIMKKLEAIKQKDIPQKSIQSLYLQGMNEFKKKIYNNNEIPFKELKGKLKSFKLDGLVNFMIADEINIEKIITNQQDFLGLEMNSIQCD